MTLSRFCISKRHFARQFPRFFCHPLGLGLQSGDFLLQFLPLRGGDLLDHGFVLFHFPEDLHGNEVLFPIDDLGDALALWSKTWDEVKAS